MRDNKMARWRDGRTFVGKPPFGYLWDQEAKRLEVNEREAAIYREIVQMYCGLSLSMKDIAIKLNDRGLKAKRRPFSSVTISDILKNPAYYGHYVLNKHVYKDGKRGTGTRRTKELKPESEHIIFDIPTLISKPEWDAIQAKTDFNKTKSKRAGYDQKFYWLRDLLVCGQCGGAVKPHHGVKRKDGGFPRYYTCYWSMMNGKTLKLSNKQKCDLPNIRAERFEAEVWNAIMKPYLFHSGAFKDGTWIPSKMGELLDASRYDKTISETTKLIETFQTEFKRLNTARERIFDLIEDERFDKNEMVRRLNRNREETLTTEGKIREARQKLAQAEAAKQNDDLYRQFIRDKKSVLRKLAADLQKLSPEDRKRLAEGSITGKIKLVRTYDDETDTFSAAPKLECNANMALLKEFMEEGKIGKLSSKDSSHHIAGYEF